MSQPKVLISEEHSLTRQALVASLNSLGFHNIITATSNEQALQIIFLEKEIDILICSLPTSSSQKLSFLRHASKYGHINSILLLSDISAHLNLAVTQFARHSGYDLLGVLSKPFNKTELKAALLAHKPKSSTDTTLSLAEMPSANDIAQSLHKNEFVPYYQPKLDLHSGKVVGAEILMRWKHPQLGLLGPGAFIEVAKHFGHLDAMTFEVLAHALKFITAQNFEGDFKIAVNIEPAQLANPTLHEEIAALLLNEKVDPANLIIEITETGVLESPANCMENLIRLRMLGCGISIDDFGAGFSSLQRICELPCTEIKMDMSFTKALMNNKRSECAIESMVQFSKAIGVQLVIEGIETEEQLATLRKLNCRIGQGYLISAPIPGDELAQWIGSQHMQQSPQLFHYDSK